MKYISLTFATLFFCILQPLQAKGDESVQEKEQSDWFYEVRVGLLAHDVDNPWSDSRKEKGADINAEIIFGRPSFSILSGTVRPNLGVSINTRGDTSKLYSGLVWELAIEYGLVLNLGIGAAIHDGELKTRREGKKELGSRVLFRIPIEIGYTFNGRHQVSMAFDHLSNANLASPNEGLDTFGLRYGYRF